MPDYNALNYIGSSGYGPIGTGFGRVYTPPPDPNAGPSDYPLFDASTGKLISRKTGKAWAGELPPGWVNPYGSAASAASARGVQVPYAAPGTMINPNDPTQRYKPVDIVKSPDIAKGEEDLMKTFQDSASSALKDFGTYLSNFKNDLSAARTAGKAATDPATIASDIATMRGDQARYQSGLEGDVAQLADINRQNAAAEQGIVGQANAILPQYDAAAQAVADQQMQAVQRNLSRYKMGTGTPSSAGGDEARILANAAAQVYAPFQQAKIDRQLQLLTGLALPVQRDIINRATAAATGFNPQAQGEIFRSGMATERDVQNLRDQVAGMSYQQALQFMQAAQIPANIMQQILSGQIGQLGALGQLEDQSRYRFMQDVLGAYPSQPVGFRQAQPPFPNYPSRYPGTGNTLNPGNAPIIAGAGAGVPLGDIPGGVPYNGLPGSIGGAPFAPGRYGVNASTFTGTSGGPPGMSYTRNPDGSLNFAGPNADYYNLLYGGGGAPPPSPFTGDVNLPDYSAA